MKDFWSVSQCLQILIMILYVMPLKIRQCLCEYVHSGRLSIIFRWAPKVCMSRGFCYILQLTVYLISKKLYFLAQKNELFKWGKGEVFLLAIHLQQAHCAFYISSAACSKVISKRKARERSQTKSTLKNGNSAEAQPVLIVLFLGPKVGGPQSSCENHGFSSAVVVRL